MTKEENEEKLVTFMTAAINNTKLTTSNVTYYNAAVDVRDEQLAAVEIAVLAVIFCVALVGNSFVLIALWRQIRFCPKSRMYLFMLHLSLADVLVAIFSILPQMIWKITFRFRGGDISCRAVKYMQIMVLYLSTYILVMMAVDRYRAICWASNLHWNSLKVAKGLIAGAWLLSLIFAIPQPIIFRMVELEGLPGVHDCWVVFGDQWGARAYVTWFVISAFIVPLIILAFCYGVISYKIWTYNPEGVHYSVHMPNGGTGSHKGQENIVMETLNAVRPTPPPAMNMQRMRLRQSGQNHISHAKLKTIKLTFIVIVCFFICWSPFCITQLIMVYDPPDKGPVETICVLLACLNSCTNPWIYLAFSGSLLNHLRVCMGVGLRRAQDNDSIGDEEPELRKKTIRNQQQKPLNQQNVKMGSTKSDVV